MVFEVTLSAGGLAGMTEMAASDLLPQVVQGFKVWAIAKVLVKKSGRGRRSGGKRAVVLRDRAVPGLAEAFG